MKVKIGRERVVAEQPEGWMEWSHLGEAVELAWAMLGSQTHTSASYQYMLADQAVIYLT